MIEINLLPGQKRATAGGRRFKLPEFRTILTQIKDPWLIGAIAAAVIGLGGNFLLFGINTAKLARTERQLEAVRTEKRRYDMVVAQKRQAERIRDSLQAEMEIIRAIDANRFVWPHLLDQITRALPNYTWLTQVSALSAAPAGAAPGVPAAADSAIGMGEVRVSIDGRTVDVQAYTTFLRNLANSPWLTEVLLTNAGTVVEADRPVTSFNMTVRFRQADSLYVRTVPLVQSVR